MTEPARQGREAGRPASPRAGLCETCEHQQIVPNTRGSAFSLCRRSRDDPAYVRYPRLPVLSCPGYQPRDQGRATVD